MIDEWVGLHVAGIFFNSPLLTNKNMLPIVTDKSRHDKESLLSIKALN